MKNQKGFVVPLLLAIIAVLVVGSGVYLYNNKKVEAPILPDVYNQTSDQVQQQTQALNNGKGGNQINIPSNGTTVSTNKLSLYKNESCGFEISFPSQFVNWNRLTNPNPKQCPNSIILNKQVDALSLKSRVDCNINGSGQSPAGCNFFEVVVAGNKITGPAFENISVDNITAEKIVTIEGGVGQILIQFEKNKNWYRYTHTFSPSDATAAKKLSDSIISTFKFTN